jgi:hypothetical protein
MAMALDFAILSSKDVPIRQVPIGIADHQCIIELARHLDNGQLIARMHDYYQDVDYLPSEVPILIQEFKAIRTLADKQQVINLLVQLEQICSEALAQGLPISVIAD